MNVGIESAFSTKALYMKSDSFIRSFVKMLLMPSGRTADNYIKRFSVVSVLLSGVEVLLGKMH
jgi:hypothetical protein